MSDRFGETTCSEEDEPLTRTGYSKIPSRYLETLAETPKIKQLTLVLAFEDGQMLLGMKKRGFGMGKWNGFGGKVEAGESIEEGAVRELQEESGCILSAGHLRKQAIITFVFKHDPTIMQVHLFTAPLSKLQGEPRETEEMRPQRFSCDALPFQDMWADDHLWFPRMLAGKEFEGAFLFEGEAVVEYKLADREEGWARALNLADIHDLNSLVAADVLRTREAAMREDEGVMIVGDNVLLVPYLEEHVEAYHLWMQDEELLRFTGSEPQTLQQERAMLDKWRADTDKCTFIVLHKPTRQMIGDVNLFMYEEEDPTHAEVNVMVAEKAFRRQGLAREIVRLMMDYGYRRLGVRVFAAKIDDDNAPSLALFAALGFRKESYSTAFKQHTLIWKPASLEAVQDALLDSSTRQPYAP